MRLGALAHRAGTLLALLCWSTAGPSHAAQWWSDGDASLSVSGSLRQLAVYTRQTESDAFSEAIAADILAAGPATSCVPAANFADCPAFDKIGQKDVTQGLTRLRLEADLRISRWLSAFVSYDNDLRFGQIQTLESTLSSGFQADDFLGAESRLSSDSQHEWNHRLYRGFLRVETERFEFNVGRQRIAWGVGRLWTPIDRFSALPPLNLQPDVTQGIDSFDGRFNFDGFNYLQFVYAPGDRRQRERWAIRLHGVARNTDYSAMAGVFEGAPTFGIDLARNLFEGAIGVEAVFTSPRREVWKIGDAAAKELSDYWQVVASFDLNLDVGSGIHLLAEYLYNGNAFGFGSGRAGPLLPLFEATNVLPDAALAGLAIPAPYAAAGSRELFGSSRIITNAEHQLGFQIGTDLTPEMRVDFVTLVDLDGSSAAFFPNLRYSPLDPLELTLGVQFFAGPKRSQYGNSEPLVHLLADWFF